MSPFPTHLRTTPLSAPLHVIESPEPDEKSAHDAYLEHIADCLACDPGAGRACTLGSKLHRRWRVAASGEATT